MQGKMLPGSIRELRKRFSPTAQPNLSKTHDGIPQNFASRKGVTKLHIAINMYQNMNSCPKRMQAYEDKTTYVE